jgi:hypothetical protein
MPGFTAFNAHASQALAPVTGASPQAHDTSSSRRKLMTRRQPARKKTATTRDMEQTTADDTTRKPISGKDIKRTSHPGDKPEVKRRKSGSVKSSMSTTKSAVGATRTADSNEVKASKDASHSSTEAASVSLTSMAKLNGFRYNSGQAARPVDPQTVQSTSISYAPETSMIIVSSSHSCSISSCWERPCESYHMFGDSNVTDCWQSSNARCLRLPCKPCGIRQEVAHFCTQALRLRASLRKEVVFRCR